MAVTPTKIIFAALLVAYPALVYFGLTFFDARSIAILLILLVAARLLFAGRSDGWRAFKPQLIFALVAAAAIGALVMISNSPLYLKFYPVCMSALMLILFTVSLIRPPTVIERLARVRNPDLPESAVRYTRKVTIVWCGFFVINGCIALYTALFSSLEIWTLYNGAISYGLMGCLFAGEYLVRRRVQKKAVA